MRCVLFDHLFSTECLLPERLQPKVAINIRASARKAPQQAYAAGNAGNA
jgi:hypothetical protein